MIENLPKSKEQGCCPISGLTIFQPDHWKDVILSERCSCSYFLIGNKVLLSKPIGFAGLEEVRSSMNFLDKVIKNYLKDKDVILMHDYSGITRFSEKGREYYLTHKKTVQHIKYIIFYGTSPLLKLGIKLGNIKLANIDFYIVKSYEEAINIVLAKEYNLSKVEVEDTIDRHDKIFLNYKGNFKSESKHSDDDNYVNIILELMSSIDWNRPGLDDKILEKIPPRYKLIYDAITLIKSDFDKILEEQKKHNAFLKEQKEAYSRIFDNVTDYLYAHDLNGNIIHINASWKNLGYDSSNLNNLTLRDIIPKRYHDEIDDYLKKIKETGKLKGVMRVITKKGEEYIIEYNNVVIYDPELKQDIVYGIGRDITSRQKLEKQLKYNEMLFRGIMESSADPIVLLNEMGELLYVNPSFCTIFHYRRDEVLSKELFFLKKENRIFIKNRLQTAGAINGYDAVGYKKNGEEIYLSINVSKIQVEGIENRFVMILRDETEKVLAHRKIQEYNEQLEALVEERTQQLRESEERYRTILETIEDGYFEVNLAGDLIFCNDALLRITGFEKEELIGKNNREYTDEENAKKLFDAFNKVYKTGKPIRALEWEMITKNKDKRYIENSITLVKDRYGKPIGFRGIVRDVTERKLMEQKLIEAKEIAENASRAKTMFLANISHEIRTPLNGIIGLCEILSDMDLSHEASSLVKNILTEANMLFGLINNILDLSKIEAGKLEFEHIEFNLRELLLEVANIFTLRAKEKGLDFYCDIPSELPQIVIGDPTRIRQVLYNLLGNAVKFTLKGSVGLSCKILQQDQQVVSIEFYIKDTGIGIPSSKLKDIFQAFVQADASMTRRFGGTGLGISLSKELIELMGGELRCESKEGEGSVFSFNLTMPFADKRDIIFDNECRNEELVSPNCQQGCLGCVLVAEDYESNQKVVKRHLETAGFCVDIASNGREVIELFKKNKYNLVLMDIQMPEMDGYTATEKIRDIEKINNLSPTPIIAMTAHALKSDKEKCLSCGMNDYISKPIRKKELISLVSKWVAKNIKEQHELKSAQDINLATTNSPLNLDKALEEFDHDKEFLLDVLENFLINLEKQIKKIKEAIKLGEMDKIAKEAHAVKGGAYNLCADNMGDIAYELEMSAKQENIELSKDALVKLEYEFSRLRDVYKKLQG